MDKQDRKVKIERLIVKCKDAFIRVVDKNEELFDLTQKTEDPDAACMNLEKWLETVTKKTDEFIAAARGYINSVHDKETEELYTFHHSRSGSHMSSSKRSDQRQQDLKISRLKREELEKHKAKLCIARQRHETENQTKLRDLEIEQLEENHRKEVAIATLERIELMTKTSADGSGTGKRASSLRKEVQSREKNLFKIGLFRHQPGTWQKLQTNRVCTFLVPSPNPTKQLSDVLQLNFQTYTRSSIHKANINLHVHEPQELSSRNNVTNDANKANNIMQEQQQPEYTPPSPPISFGMPAQLNAPNTARQLPQATMQFDCLN